MRKTLVIFRCDRCKKESTEDSNLYKWGKIQFESLCGCELDSKYFDGADDEDKLHLCENCRSSFITWWKN